MNKLQQIRSMTVVAADTGDTSEISKYILQDAMAIEYLAEGIRVFGADQCKLEYL